MAMNQLSVGPPTQLIANKIRERTGGGVSGLEVVLIGGRVVVRGCTCSYYSWQLAMAACRDLRLEFRDLMVDLEINVNRN
jgi:hypothetical protein